jgi:hypothetical protein
MGMDAPAKESIEEAWERYSRRRLNKLEIRESVK